MKLITEQSNNFNDYKVLYEQKNTDTAKTLTIKGPFLVSEVRNVNERLYTAGVIEQAVATYQNDYIDCGRSFGEMNHPTHTRIDYERACCRATKFTRQDNIWIGEAQVLMSDNKFNIKGTKHGDILASILQHGGRPGVSSRGVGEMNDKKIIDTSYTLIAVDVVPDPSGPGCFVSGILESKDFLVNAHGDIMEVAIDQFESKTKNMPKTFINENKTIYIQGLFESFLANIK